MSAGAGERRRVGTLVVSNLLGGIGVASSVAVSGLLVEHLGATSIAGLGQASSVLGAAVAAIPLAGLAERRGRRRSLAVGYVIALAGAGVVLLSAAVHSLPLLLLGLACFGVSQATNLQSRYAATDGVPATSRARTMSIVVWATTIGSVAGPNLSDVGERAGESVGPTGLAGPYLFSAAAFALAMVVITLGLPGPAPALTQPTSAAAGIEGAATRVTALEALRWALGHPRARLGVVLLAAAHATMVMVMVMTPLHMQHHGMSITVVGLVISLHVVGMYAVSPLFGWLTDAWGALRTAALGTAVLGLAVVVGFVSAATDASEAVTAAALVLLGLGWSASTIAASSVIAATAADGVRLPLQGAADAGMNYAGALAAVVAGPLLAGGGFQAVNVAGAVLLVPVVALLTLLTSSVAAQPKRPEM
ncbi:MFS transporter [Nocardioides cheoyonin]|uniref:MFS transporter n=1 Tax=Nocardioides cheoyonin TaxID=3156615 RepID=UPI0032B5CD8F